MEKVVRPFVMGILIFSLIGYFPMSVHACSVAPGTTLNLQIYDREGKSLSNHAMNLDIDAACNPNQKWMYFGGNQLVYDINEDGTFELVEIDDSKENYKILDFFTEFPDGKHDNKPIIIQNQANLISVEFQDGSSILSYEPIDSYIQSSRFEFDLEGIGLNISEIMISVDFVEFENSMLVVALSIYESNVEFENFQYGIYLRYSLEDGSETFLKSESRLLSSSLDKPDLDPSGRYFITIRDTGGVEVFDMQEAKSSSFDYGWYAFESTAEGIWAKSENQLTLYDYQGNAISDQEIEVEDSLGNMFMVLDDYVLTIHLKGSGLQSLPLDPVYSLVALFAMAAVFRYQKRSITR